MSWCFECYINDSFRQRYQKFLDTTVPHLPLRWVTTLVLTLLFLARIFYLQVWISNTFFSVMPGFSNVNSCMATGFTGQQSVGLNFFVIKTFCWSNQVRKIILTAVHFAWCPAPIKKSLVVVTACMQSLDVIQLSFEID